MDLKLAQNKWNCDFYFPGYKDWLPVRSQLIYSDRFGKLF